MTTYQSITDLIQHEVKPAIATDNTLTPEQVASIADEVCTRMQAAGMIVWEDGWSERDGVHYLSHQGFRMAVEHDDDDYGEQAEAFWAIVADVLAEKGNSEQ